MLKSQHAPQLPGLTAQNSAVPCFLRGWVLGVNQKGVKGAGLNSEQPQNKDCEVYFTLVPQEK